MRCSSFDIGKLRCHFAVADGENVDSANVPRLSVALLAIDPEHDGTVATYDHIFRVEDCISIPRTRFARKMITAAAILKIRANFSVCMGMPPAF